MATFQGALLLAALLGLPERVQACTTILVGKSASASGHPMATHSNDGGGTTDPRLVRIEADPTAGKSTRRDVFAAPENYPRYVGYERAPEYYPESTEGRPAAWSAVGSVPQAAETYAYWEQTYGVMNEMSVGTGESTCSAMFAATAVEAGGEALLSIDALSQIAMERATSARQAVQLMGDLAMEHGFHGESTSFEGSGESLMVVDHEEGFVFHVLSDPTGRSAIWAAQRVPDDGVAVVANMYTIRVMDLDDTDQFLGRQDMWELAEREGLWTPDAPKDFTFVFSDGEYAHKYYTGRRMWGSLRVLAPDVSLPAEYRDLREDAPYPFAVTVEAGSVSRAMVFAAMRTTYEGTEYDQSLGMGAGPFGAVDRYGGSTNVDGNWERPVGLYRTSDSYVIEARDPKVYPLGGLVWFGPAAAHGTFYVPFSTARDAPRAPSAYSEGWQGDLTRENNAFGTFRFLRNVCTIQWEKMGGALKEAQVDIEARGADLVAKLEASGAPRPAMMAELNQFALDALDAANHLADELVLKYADGYVSAFVNGTYESVSIGYPEWWLKSDDVGFTSGPPPASPRPPIGEMAECAPDDEILGCVEACLRKRGGGACVRGCAGALDAC